MDFSSDKLKKAEGKFLKGLPIMGGVIFVVTFVLLSVYAVWPRIDSDAKATNDRRVQELTITFNKKLLDQLTNPPASKGPVTSRNPFAN